MQPRCGEHDDYWELFLRFLNDQRRDHAVHALLGFGVAQDVAVKGPHAHVGILVINHGCTNLCLHNKNEKRAAQRS